MMTITEKTAYIKGLAEGLALDANKPETKLINELVKLVDELANELADLQDDALPRSTESRQIFTR